MPLDEAMAGEEAASPSPPANTDTMPGSDSMVEDANDGGEASSDGTIMVHMPNCEVGQTYQFKVVGKTPDGMAEMQPIDDQSGEKKGWRDNFDAEMANPPDRTSKYG